MLPSPKQIVKIKCARIWRIVDEDSFAPEELRCLAEMLRIVDDVVTDVKA
jgi:hypothetical protein